MPKMHEKKNVTMQTTLMACASVALVGAIGFETSRSVHAQGGRAPAAAQQAPTPARQLVTTYCVTCHNERLKTGGLMLDKADAEQLFNSAETWEKVIVKLRSRAMPPPGIRRPDNATYDAVAGWLETELDRAAATHVNPGRPADLHRLNRTEYANAVRDLFGVEIDAPSMLPPDEQAYGFDTNADALSMEPALLDRYLTAAAKIVRLAIGDPTIRPAFERYTSVKGNANAQTWLWQTDRLGEEFPLGSRGGIAARHYFPVDGEYVLKVVLGRTYMNQVRGLNVPNQIEIRVDGTRVGQFSLGGGPEFAAAQETASASDYRDAQNTLAIADDALQVRVPLKAGLWQVVVTVVKSNDVKPEGLGPNRIPIWSRESDVPSAPLFVSSLLIGGPYDGQVPQDSPSRRRIFVCHPAGSTEETACATKILSTLARRAYRRATTNEDNQTLLDFYKSARANGDFDTGIRAALERLLVSPDFLFRIEADPDKVAPGTVYRLSDIELASRLSFFLWSSIPDDELLDLAIRGKLRDAGVLDQQVRRMLADPRTRTALVDNFFEQWLQTRNVWLLRPDANTKFPWFDDNLRTAMVKETELFLDAQLKEDRGIVDLLTANYTFLNEQLARHYGIPGVYGSHFRRVTLTDENRWGLLGKASVLAVTSYPTRTAPTIRGKWLLENILAAPVPPPPPDVNTNLDAQATGKPTSVRDMLETHRKNPVCASCHARMDPLGFSLENFDALGQWRTTDGGTPINATGVLLDGTKVDGPAALRRALVAQKEQFVKTVAGKLLTYTLGREMEYFDAPAIRGIVRAAAPDYRWSSAILALVKSAPFQMRRAAAGGDGPHARQPRVGPEGAPQAGSHARQPRVGTQAARR
jgi:mono/diheme cytochrome c family protein